jgi:hypothetical protein
MVCVDFCGAESVFFEQMVSFINDTNANRNKEAKES